MATTPPIRPTKLELSILNVLWQNGPATVREIHAIVNASKPTAVNTVLRMLQIMTEKDLVTRDETVRPQIYRARYSQQQTQTHLVKDLIQRAFDGSVKEMVMRALSTRKPSPKTLKAMEKLLEEFEGDSK
jgi:predicted transcriptional regulator